jgi:hypothetical protein
MWRYIFIDVTDCLPTLTHTLSLYRQPRRITTFNPHTHTHTHTYTHTHTHTHTHIQIYFITMNFREHSHESHISLTLGTTSLYSYFGIQKVEILSWLLLMYISIGRDSYRILSDRWTKHEIFGVRRFCTRLKFEQNPTVPIG